MKIVTNWSTLIMKARMVAQAEAQGNVIEIEQARAELEAYEELIKQSDCMTIPQHK